MSRKVPQLFISKWQKLNGYTTRLVKPFDFASQSLFHLKNENSNILQKRSCHSSTIATKINFDQVEVSEELNSYNGILHATAFQTSGTIILSRYLLRLLLLLQKILYI